MPVGDSEDPSELPDWFRAYLREQLPGLPASGRFQYPREAEDLFRQAVEDPGVSSTFLRAEVRELESLVPMVLAQNERRSLYPEEWEVPVPEGTLLAGLQGRLEEEFSLLPEGDLEDQTALPVWFRVWMRQNHQDLPTTGPYQYPKTANRILRRMLDNPDSAELQ